MEKEIVKAIEADVMDGMDFKKLVSKWGIDQIRDYLLYVKHRNAANRGRQIAEKKKILREIAALKNKNKAVQLRDDLLARATQ